MPTEEEVFKEKLRTIMREYHKGMGASTYYYIICLVTGSRHYDFRLKDIILS